MKQVIAAAYVLGRSPGSGPVAGIEGWGSPVHEKGFSGYQLKDSGRVPGTTGSTLPVACSCYFGVR